jgi:crossover junction endodeoxyribonuclease RuvC
VEDAFYAKNVRTTIALSQARGVILLAAEQAAVEIAEYEPRLVKKAVVGTGAALKPQVAFMVAQILRLKTPPSPADAADGVAVALTHLLRTAGGPVAAFAAMGRPA